MARKKSTKKQAETAVKHIKKTPLVVFIVILVLLIIAFGVCFYLYKTENPAFMSLYNKVFGEEETQPTAPSSPKDDATWDVELYDGTNNFIPVNDKELSIHFLQLGNEYTGDCVYIKAGETDILVDAGSRASSVSTIDSYLKQYVTDGTLEFVIVTHADRDHIAGFAAKNGLFSKYDCEIIIDFAKTNKTTDTYNDYITNRDAEIEAGAKHFTALECWNKAGEAEREYQLATDIKMSILYQKFYEEKTSDENDYSVCFLITYGEKNYLFTGDLEKDGEASLVQNNTLPKVELFKAGHHGSKTSTTDALLEVIQPEIVCVCCCAGSVEYTQNNDNTFPTQDFINRVSKYTDKVYVTSRVNLVYNEEKQKFENGEYKLMNGNIVVSTSGVTVTVQCSHNDLILKDTAWFKNKRTCPPEWKVA